MRTKNVRKSNSYVTKEEIFKSVEGLQRSFREGGGVSKKFENFNQGKVPKFENSNHCKVLKFENSNQGKLLNFENSNQGKVLKFENLIKAKT